MDNAKIIVNVEHRDVTEHKESFAEGLIAGIGESLLERLVVLVIKFFVFLFKSIFD